MGFLDNSSIVVDAVLTKQGRELLKNGNSLQIDSFTLSDTGVDYSLWNPDHPDGSAFHGEAIENLPMLEASVHSEYNLRNRLLTLPQNAIAIPVLLLGGALLDSVNNTITFKDGDANRGKLNATLHNFSSVGPAMGMTVLIQDPTVVDTNLPNGKLISGTSAANGFLQEQDIAQAREYDFIGGDFQLIPIQQDVANRQTNVFIYDKQTGAYNSLRIINNITKNIRASQSTRVIGA